MNPNDVFVESVRKTLSDMAFLDVTATTCPDNPLSVSHIIYIEYSGTERGSIAMLLPKEFKKAVVENIYGETWEELNAEEIDDCLLEILNVVAGDYLSELYGSDIKRELSLPRLVFDEFEIGDAEAAESFFFDAEELVFEIRHVRENRA